MLPNKPDAASCRELTAEEFDRIAGGTPNSERIARFTTELYVEHVKFTLNEVDA